MSDDQGEETTRVEAGPGAGQWTLVGVRAGDVPYRMTFAGRGGRERAEQACREWIAGASWARRYGAAEGR